MRGFYQHEGQWCVEEHSLANIAKRFSSPCYVYSRSVLQDAYDQLVGAFCHSKPQICYAVKANDNLSILHLLASFGAGFDIVSGGELARVLAAGARANSVVFSGVGKSREDIDFALSEKIRCFNVESCDELRRIEQCAHLHGEVAPVAFRLTLDIDGQTHRHLTTGLSGGKFGVNTADVMALVHHAQRSPVLEFVGFSCHIGSQIAAAEAYVQLARAMAQQVARCEAQGVAVPQIDMGGGFAVVDEVMAHALSLSSYDRTLARLFAGRQLIIEPGRWLVAAAGVLLAQVEYVKHAAGKPIWVINVGMNSFLRPALYGATHPVVAVASSDVALRPGDVVGPICESADVIATDCQLAAVAGDLLAIFNVGAYGAVMSSNYNARPRLREVLVDGQQLHEIRRPETFADMMRLEQSAVRRR